MRGILVGSVLWLKLLVIVSNQPLVDSVGGSLMSLRTTSSAKPIRNLVNSASILVKNYPNIKQTQKKLNSIPFNIMR